MTLYNRIVLALAAFREDNADIDIMVGLLTECQVVINQADENFKSIVDTCTMIDDEIDRLQGMTFGRVQAS